MERPQISNSSGFGPTSAIFPLRVVSNTQDDPKGRARSDSLPLDVSSNKRRPSIPTQTLSSTSLPYLGRTETPQKKMRNGSLSERFGSTGYASNGLSGSRLSGSGTSWVHRPRTVLEERETQLMGGGQERKSWRAVMQAYQPGAIAPVAAITSPRKLSPRGASHKLRESQRLHNSSGNNGNAPEPMEEDDDFLPRVLHLSSDYGTKKGVPLEAFDNAEKYDRTYTNADFLAQFPKSGRSRFFNVTTKESSWEPCEVLSFDENSQLFRIRWPSNGKYKSVTRLNLLFDVDDPETHQRRIQEASDLKSRVQASKDYADVVLAYSADVRPIDDEQLRSILASVSADSEVVTHRRDLVNELIDDVRLEFDLSMKKASYEYHNDVDEAVAPRPAPAPFLGTVELPADTPSFRENLESVLNTSFFANAAILKVLQDVFMDGYSISDLSLLSFQGPDFNKALHLKDFCQRQRDLCEKGINTLFSWKDSITARITSHLQNVFDFGEINEDSYRESRFQRFLRLISLIMDAQLRKIARNSIDSMISFFDQFDQFVVPSGEALFVGVVAPSHGPVFYADIVLDTEGKPLYTPSLSAIQHGIEGIVDEVLRTVSLIPKVDVNVLSSLSLRHECIQTINANDKFIVDSKYHMDKVIERNFGGMERFAVDYQNYVAALLQNVADSKAQATEGEANMSVDQLMLRIDKYFHIVGSILNRSLSRIPMSVILIDCQEYKTQLANGIKTRADTLLSNMLDNIRFRCTEILDICTQINERVNAPRETPEQYHDFVKYYQGAKSSLQQLLGEYDVIKKKWAVLERFYYAVQETDVSMYWDVYSRPQELLVMLQRVDLQLQNERTVWIRQLDEQKYQFQQDLIQFEGEIDSFKVLFDVEKAEEYFMLAQEMDAKLQKAKALPSLFNSRERGFEQRVTSKPAKDIAQCIKNFEPFFQLWDMAHTYQKNILIWMHGPFPEIDAEKVESEVSHWTKLIAKLERVFRGLPAPLQAIGDLKKRLDEFRVALPIIINLRFIGMRDRHWGQLSATLGYQIRPTMDMTLTTLLEQGFAQQVELLAELRNLAAKEFSLEKQLEGMISEWDHMSLELVVYREVNHVLRGVDKIMEVLEDQIVKTQAMRSSAFIKPFEERIRVWEEKLTLIEKLMTEWLQLQSQWLYLEPIFSSNDIMQQMPTEARRFATVDVIWKALMKETLNQPKLKVIAGQAGLLDKLTECNKRLEAVQKSLNYYLETKRTAFARFYFLSNEELLEILSQARDPRAVQPHLKKCFENINSLEFGANLDISAMYSVEMERIDFLGLVQTRETVVENWLLAVERSMRETMKDQIFRALQSYSDATRDQWVVSWPGQVILAVNELVWTQSVTEAMRENGLLGLKAYRDLIEKQINQVVKLMRTDTLSATTRTALESLIVIAVHNRDVVSALIDAEVTSEADFEWNSKLRYYWEEETIKVRMVNSCVNYGYEYLGTSGRLVVTPLTERCYTTLMCALHLSLGGAPEGPAGTGKTETTKDLAKALAKQCLVFNCSEGLNYVAMGRFFKGIASAGAWACFDEFNRIDVEVLSVIAQQIMTIQRAIINNQPRLMFEGADIKLDPSCAVFITMNPGYAGRSELPTNLKALFRPMSMMVPDYAIIAEISLFSYGFTHNARKLAQKLVSTFRLSSEQLSSQSHYDFGMRAVKSTLLAAGAFKRAEPHENEEILIIRALIDINVPKFLADDIPLFNGIISDLFPGVVPTMPDVSILSGALEDTCRKLNLQPVPDFITKCLQLYAMTQVRHGIMLVGETLAGKSTCMQVLAAAQTSLREGGSPRYNSVEILRCNPKAITMEQLYGDFNAVSREWTDGVLPTIVRKCAAKTDPRNNEWITFDGPVDALWIENMNTVLDDNKKLCLSSGEIIKLAPTNLMIFEVRDLAVASPATVSRCGMIYMEPDGLGWRPIVQSWLNSVGLPEPLQNAERRGQIMAMFQWLVDPCLHFIQSKCKEAVPGLVHTGLVRSLVTIFDSLLRDFLAQPASDDPAAAPPAGGDDEDDAKLLDKRRAAAEKELAMRERNLASWIESLFVFALVWSIGSAIDHDSRSKFSTFVKESVAQSAKPKPAADAAEQAVVAHEPADGAGSVVRLRVPLPDEGDLFDYVFVKQSGQWTHWMKTVVPQPPPPEGIEFSQVVVPVLESVRATYLLELLIRHHHHVLFVGPTGTSKTITIKDVMSRLDKDQYTNCYVNFSYQTTANQTQDIIDAKLVKKMGTDDVYQPTSGKHCVVYVDDLNMPAQDSYGAQAAIEVLRQVVDNGGWYDRKTNAFKHVNKLQFVASMQAEGKTPITSRYLSSYVTISMTSFGDESLRVIFREIVSIFGAVFPTNLRPVCDQLVEASIAIYGAVISELLPTPAKSHYLFNVRVLSQVFQGMLSVSPGTVTRKQQLLRLWLHECRRVFDDRLVDDRDRGFFHKLLDDTLNKTFGESIEQLMVGMDCLLYGDFLQPGALQRSYGEVSDKVQLRHVMEEYLDDYNLTKMPNMHLVLFDYAVEHITRICRIIRQPQGHALLIGLPGSGRESCTKLAAHMCESELGTVDIKGSYTLLDWRADLRKFVKAAGMQGRSMTFLLKDSQVTKDAFLEDINNLLNTGDVPSLWPPDELAKLISDVIGIAQEAGHTDTSKQGLYNFFVARCRKNMHVVFCVSPGDNFRNLIRKFPALVNCTTIDWFSEWPLEALRSVASQFLERSSDQLTPNQRDTLVDLTVQVHAIAAANAERFFQELRRPYFISPFAFLYFIELFMSLLVSKRHQTNTQKARYSGGVNKLLETKEIISKMSKDLAELQPFLKTTSDETAALMRTIETEKTIADAAQVVIVQKEQQAQVQAAAAQKIKDECEADLNKVLPILQESEKALETLNKNDVNEIKSMKSPPAGVKLVMETICILKGIKPNMETAPNGQKVPSYWESAKKMLSDMHFLESLIEFDKDHIPDPIIDKLHPYMLNPEFVVAKIQKVSVAATSLCKWVRAVETYHHVLKEVNPKKLALAQAEAELKDVIDNLARMRSELAAMQDKIATLNASLKEAEEKLEGLTTQARKCEVQMERAHKLIAALGGEGQRWTQAAAALEAGLDTLMGDVFLSAAAIAYSGPFTGKFRDQCTTAFQQLLSRQRINFSPNYSLPNTFSDPVFIRGWIVHGLPPDKVSIENAVIVDRTTRWPLIIDPQGQANKWIRNMEAGRKLVVSSFQDDSFLRNLANAVRFGMPVLIEDVNEGEQLKMIEPLLLKQFVKQGGRDCVRLGDGVIEYSDEFRLYITTKHHNPKFSPDIATKVSVLNFTVTQDGLEDQLLSIVVSKERPDLEEEKNQLTLENSKNKKKLKETEDSILEVMSSAQGGFLDDDVLVDKLELGKKVSNEVRDFIAAAEITEKKIDETRIQYRSAAQHAANLFFCVTDLAAIGPMYQYSLDFFIALYRQAIDESTKATRIEQRLASLNSYFTLLLYRKICLSLFEKDKLLYSFMLTSKILQAKGELDAQEWRFFLLAKVDEQLLPSGGSMTMSPSLGSVTEPRPTSAPAKRPLEASESRRKLPGSPSASSQASTITEQVLFDPHVNPAPSWLQPKTWKELVMLSHLPVFQQLPRHIAGNLDAWKAYFDSPSPQTTPLPAEWNTQLKPLQRLLVLRCLRPDKVAPGVQVFIEHYMGAEFTAPPVFDLVSIFKDSVPWTPLVFVLSANVSDPRGQILELADKIKFSEKKFVSVSLGQGQGPVAEAALADAIDRGKWVLLQNCHLAVSWLPTLEKIVSSIDPQRTHHDFRLWLTSEPSERFPVKVLQNSLKLTNEPPKGLRSNLFRTFAAFDDTFFNSCRHPDVWKKLLFSLCFFHASIQERRRFGPLGWNINYDFNESDFNICMRQLRMFLDATHDVAAVPWTALNYLGAEINYGGRVTDRWDKRTLSSTLLDFYNKRILHSKFRFGGNELYAMPPDGAQLADYVALINALPPSEAPTMFGLHDNAAITVGIADAQTLFDALVSLQPRASSLGSSTTLVIVKLAEQLLEQLPPNIDLDEAVKLHPINFHQSLNTVLKHEVTKYNALLSVIRKSLKELLLALEGLIVMSNTLEETGASLYVNQVPKLWKTKSFASLKPLASWMLDLEQRVAFINSWIYDGIPTVFWFSGLFSPQAFLTAVLQNYSRSHKVSIDSVTYEFKFLNLREEQIEKPPVDGCYIKGLYLEGAAWDADNGILQEARPRELFSPMPIIWLSPLVPSVGRQSKTAAHKQPAASAVSHSSYACPVYRTTNRFGVLSTTGHSTNYVLTIDVPSRDDDKKWIARGVAMFCCLSD
eukprot:TRINITY_DN225_c0_g1_i6.p1 TRINITY_DN225_c0_g1~~TRINITY_DN225_c0_g1_i6.p1  ORF type:complete len:4288 (+),score=2116.54 TRINITY_DN225_c0_g1_i6:207-13070(+)